MKTLQFLSEFEITLSGGFAIYAILCMLFVLVVGITQILDWMVKHLP